MFEQAFKNIDNILHTDSGSAMELDYVEQTSWILFLKYLDDLDETKKTEAAFSEKNTRTFSLRSSDGIPGPVRKLLMGNLIIGRCLMGTT